MQTTFTQLNKKSLSFIKIYFKIYMYIFTLHFYVKDFLLFIIIKLEQYYTNNNCSKILNSCIFHKKIYASYFLIVILLFSNYHCGSIKNYYFLFTFR